MNSLQSNIKYTYNVVKQRFTSSRFTTFIILQLFIFFIYLIPFRNFCIAADYPISPFSIIILFFNHYFTLYFMLIIIYYFSDVPFMGSHQMYQIIRTGRTKWALSKIISIIIFSFICMILAFIMTFIPLIGHIEFTSKWGKVIYTLCTSDIAIKYNIATYNTVKFYTPIKALIQVFITGGLLISFIALLMYALSILFSRLIAVSVAFVVLFFHIAATNIVHFIPSILKISPVSWMNINNIDMVSGHNLPTFSYIVTVLTSAIVILSIIILIRVKTINFDFNKED